MSLWDIVFFILFLPKNLSSREFSPFSVEKEVKVAHPQSFALYAQNEIREIYENLNI